MPLGLDKQCFYVYSPGELVKFRQYSQYTVRNLNPWIWFVVDKVEGSKVHVHLNEHPEQKLVIESIDLDPPIGYEDIYTVVVKTEEMAERVWSWLGDRGGIAVWTSHDLGNPGRQMFTPATMDGKLVDGKLKPHWSMGLTEIVKDPKRIKIEIETTTEKVDKKDRKNWTYDKHNREWYQRRAWSQKEMEMCARCQQRKPKSEICHPSGGDPCCHKCLKEITPE